MLVFVLEKEKITMARLLKYFVLIRSSLPIMLAILLQIIIAHGPALSAIQSDGKTVSCQ